MGRRPGLAHHRQTLPAIAALPFSPSWEGGEGPSMHGPCKRSTLSKGRVFPQHPEGPSLAAGLCFETEVCHTYALQHPGSFFFLPICFVHVHF